MCSWCEPVLTGYCHYKLYKQTINFTEVTKEHGSAVQWFSSFSLSLVQSIHTCCDKETHKVICKVQVYIFTFMIITVDFLSSVPVSSSIIKALIDSIKKKRYHLSWHCLRDEQIPVLFNKQMSFHHNCTKTSNTSPNN